jgi:Na+-driven multidrug efflux pump
LQTAKYNAIFLAIVSCIFFIGAEPIVSFFTRQEDVKAVAVNALKIVSTGYVFFGVGMVLINAFNGAGDTWTPTIINFFCFWILQIPVAWLMVYHFHLGPKGVFIAIPATEAIMTIISLILFKRGRWKTIKV